MCLIRQWNSSLTSVADERLNSKELVFKGNSAVNKMRHEVTTFPESSYFPQDELRPLTMKEMTVARVYDFDFKYGRKTAWEFKDDLAAIDQSMMQSPKRNRHRLKKRRKYPKFRFAPTLEVIEENELFQTQVELELVNFKLAKDLAAIHEERALRCATPVLENGRRYRYKRRTKHFKGRN